MHFYELTLFSYKNKHNFLERSASGKVSGGALLGREFVHFTEIVKGKT